MTGQSGASARGPPSLGRKDSASENSRHDTAANEGIDRDSSGDGTSVTAVVTGHDKVGERKVSSEKIQTPSRPSEHRHVRCELASGEVVATNPETKKLFLKPTLNLDQTRLSARNFSVSSDVSSAASTFRDPATEKTNAGSSAPLKSVRTAMFMLSRPFTKGHKSKTNNNTIPEEISKEISAAPGAPADNDRLNGLLREFPYQSALFVFSYRNHFRRYVQRVILHRSFYWIMIWMTTANFFCIAVRDPFCDQNPKCFRRILLDYFDLFFTVVFTIEFILQVVARGLILHPKAYLRDAWNWIDMCVVILGYASLSPTFGNLSSIRMVRVLRAFRSLKNYLPTLRVLIKSIISVMPLMGDIGIQLCFFFFVFGIIGVQLFETGLQGRCVDQFTHELPSVGGFPSYGVFPPVVCNVKGGGRPCDPGLICITWGNPGWGFTGFDNIGMAFLTIFQVLTMSQWTQYMYWMGHYAGKAAYIYFVVQVILGSFLVLNFALACITTKFDQIDQEEARARKLERNRKSMLTVMTSRIRSLEFQMRSKISESASKIGLQGVSLFFHRVRSASDVFARRETAFHTYVSSPFSSETIRIVILLLHVCNFVNMICYYADMSSTFRLYVESLDRFFVVFFAFTSILTLMGVGMSHYFHDYFNILEAVLLLPSLVEVGMGSVPSVTNTLRLLHLVRVFARYDRKFRLLAHNMKRAMVSLMSFIPIYVIVILVLSLLGVQLFGANFDFPNEPYRRSNFDSLFNAYLTVFQIITEDDWNDIMFSAMRQNGAVACVYFIFVIVFGLFVCINVYTTIVLVNICDEPEADGEEFKDDDDDDTPLSALTLIKLKMQRIRAPFFAPGSSFSLFSSRPPSADEDLGSQGGIASAPDSPSPSEGPSRKNSMELMPVASDIDYALETSEGAPEMMKSPKSSLSERMLSPSYVPTIVNPVDHHNGTNHEEAPTNDVAPFHEGTPANVERGDALPDREEQMMGQLSRLPSAAKIVKERTTADAPATTNEPTLANQSTPSRKLSVKIAPMFIDEPAMHSGIQDGHSLAPSTTEATSSNPPNVSTRKASLKIVSPICVGDNNPVAVHQSDVYHPDSTLTRSEKRKPSLTTKSSDSNDQSLCLTSVSTDLTPLSTGPVRAVAAFGSSNSDQSPGPRTTDSDRSRFFHDEAASHIPPPPPPVKVITSFLKPFEAPEMKVVHPVLPVPSPTNSLRPSSEVTLPGVVVTNPFGGQEKAHSPRWLVAPTDVTKRSARPTGHKGISSSPTSSIGGSPTKAVVPKNMQSSKQRRGRTHRRILMPSASFERIMQGNKDQHGTCGTLVLDLIRRSIGLAPVRITPTGPNILISSQPTSEEFISPPPQNSPDDDPTATTKALDSTSPSTTKSPHTLVAESPLPGVHIQATNKHEKQAWSHHLAPHAKRLRNFLRHFMFIPAVEWVVLGVVLLSTITLGIEYTNRDIEYPGWDALDVFFMVFFLTEAALKIIALGMFSTKTAYFRDPWNCIDAIVAVSTVIGIVLKYDVHGGMSDDLQGIRAVRALRPLRLASRMRGLRSIIASLKNGLPLLVRVIVVNLVFWAVFALAGVRLFGGKYHFCTDPTVLLRSDCWGNFLNLQTGETLPRQWMGISSNFDNFYQSLQTIFEVCTLENWTQYMWFGQDAVGVDIAMQQRYNVWAAWYFHAVVLVCLYFGLNMVVAVNVTEFRKSRQAQEQGGNDGQLLNGDQRELRDTLIIVLNTDLRKSMNAPESGFQLQLYKVVTNFRFEMAITLLVVANVIALSTQHVPRTEEYEKIMEDLNLMFVAVFCLEAALKIFGLRPAVYFRTPWNVFDFVLCITGLVGIFMQDMTGVNVNPMFLRVLRIIRLARIFRLARRFKGIRMLIATFMHCIRPSFYLGCGMMLIFFIYGVVGVELFEHVAYTGAVTEDANFSNLPNALITEFRIMTGENWNSILWTCMDPKNCLQGHCGGRIAPIFFISFMFVTSIICLNLFIAVVLEAFETVSSREEYLVRMREIDRYIEAWERIDPSGSQFIRVASHFRTLLREIGSPLGLKKKDSKVTLLRMLRPLETPLSNGYVHVFDLFRGLVSRLYEEQGVQLPRHTLQIIDRLAYEKYPMLAFHHQEAEKQGMLKGQNLYLTVAVLLVQAAYRGHQVRKAAMKGRSHTHRAGVGVGVGVVASSTGNGGGEGEEKTDAGEGGEEKEDGKTSPRRKPVFMSG